MSKRFMNSQAIYNTDSNASWSDVNGFYNRVNWLAMESHSASNDDEDVTDYFMCLEQLHFEIEGAIKNVEHRKELETIRVKLLERFLKNDFKNKKLLYSRNEIAKYQRLINQRCHEYGLFLRQSISSKLDGWDNE